MSAGLRVRPLVRLALALVMVLGLLAPTVDAAPVPTLRLFVANSELTLERDRRGFVRFDPGVWVTPTGGDFELWINRPDYDTPMSLRQVDSQTRNVLRTLPIDVVRGFPGLSDFANYEIRDGRGELVASETTDYCPNNSFLQRLSDDSPLNPHYPSSCGGGQSAGPLVRGSVWGIDEGWASNLVRGYHRFGFPAPRRHYTIKFEIDQRWVDLLRIMPSQAVAEIDVTVVDRSGLDHADAGSGSQARFVESPALPFGPTPDVMNPDPSTLPDLVALPGYQMGTYSRNGRDYLRFTSTEWNQGPGTLLIEGFRTENESSMDGFQYFIDEDEDGAAIGRALIGELEFHAGGGHDHWHFEEFTRYSLLDASRARVLVSGKQSWCLINTDAIDLTVPNARWLGYGQDLSTSCGGPGRLWIREVLDVGWGDTYSQYVRGQAFNITNLPNGKYFMRVHVNPTGSIFEASTANNIEDRLIKLQGRPGHRRVVVPHWHGIDTEGRCYFC